MTLKYSENILGTPVDGIQLIGLNGDYGAQTFTPTNACYITQFKTCVDKAGAGTSVKCKIYATDVNHKPTGSALATSDVITPTTENSTEINNTFTFGGDVLLLKGVMYAAVLIAQALYYMKWQMRTSQVGIYAFHSHDGGSTWAAGNNSDLDCDSLFEVWGTPGPLEVEFSASDVKTPIDSPITFTNLSAGGVAPLSYVWDFGDTETSTEENPVHTYHVPGFYTVTLTATDDVATEVIKTKTNYIWIQPNSVLNHIVDETDVTPAVEDAWTDVLVESLVNSEATGVLLHIINTNGVEETWGVRENGDTGNTLKSVIAAGAQTWAMIGIDGSLKFEAFITSVDVKVFVYGYTMFGVEFITPVEKTISGGWTDIDCASQVGALATGLIFIVKNTNVYDQFIDNTKACGIRINGGLDSFTLGSPGYVLLAPGQMHVVTVGCDTAQICEFQTTDHDNVKLYLIGYFFDGVTFLTASLSVTPETLALYQDCDTHDISHTSGWVQLQVNCEDNASKYASLRYPGAAEDDYDIVQYGAWKWQRVSADHIFEGKVQHASVHLFVTGWAAEAAYNLVTITGVVMLGSSPVADAWVFCFNKTRSVFVGHTHTDVDGQYTFVDAGYQFEEFLVSAHCLDNALKRYGECKQITLLDIT
jgi:PKD repeat protein